MAFRMWSTKGARFIADERCKKMQKLSNFTIAFLSLEVIAINILSLTGNLENTFETKTITAITLILSVLFLVLNLLEKTKNYNVKAKDYHNCGLEIGKIYNSLKQILAKNQDADYNNTTILDDFRTAYDDVLDKHENHEEIDYARYKLNKKNEFKVKPHTYIFDWLLIYINTKFSYHFLILFIPVIMLSSYANKKTLENKAKIEKNKNKNELNNIETQSPQIKTSLNNVYN